MPLAHSADALWPVPLRGRARALGSMDLPALRALLDEHPVENVFLNARLDAAGLAPSAIGCRIWGYFRDS